MYAEFSDSIDLETNAALQALAAALRARGLPWIRDVIPALCGIAVHFDPDHSGLPSSVLEAFKTELEESFKKSGKYERAGRLVELPVCYDPEFGIDLAEVASRTGIPAEKIPEVHSESEHRVLMVGFSPGQPYIGGLDESLSLPRRASPRTRVPVGSIGIANAQTCVYSYETPGGWHVIGRTPVALFNPERNPPSLFAPGDRVSFVPISRAQYERFTA